VKSPEDAKRMFDETGCDAVMIGRACLGNPWILRRTAVYLKTGELLPEPTFVDRIDIARQHLQMMVALYGEDRGIREMRGQMAWYVKGMPGSAHLRGALSQASSLEDMEDALNAICA
jgi:tRNA-dihydrouridine synthase